MSCGHTFCRRCVGGSLPSRCPACKERFKQRELKSIRNNVLLIGVVEKCCPDETKVKRHVQEKLKANEFTEALRIATEGLDLGKGVNITKLGLVLMQLQNVIHILGTVVSKFLFWLLIVSLGPSIESLDLKPSNYNPASFSRTFLHLTSVYQWVEEQGVLMCPRFLERVSAST